MSFGPGTVLTLYRKRHVKQRRTAGKTEKHLRERIVPLVHEQDPP